MADLRTGMGIRLPLVIFNIINWFKAQLAKKRPFLASCLLLIQMKFPIEASTMRPLVRAGSGAFVFLRYTVYH